MLRYCLSLLLLLTCHIATAQPVVDGFTMMIDTAIVYDDEQGIVVWVTFTNNEAGPVKIGSEAFLMENTNKAVCMALRYREAAPADTGRRRPFPGSDCFYLGDLILWPEQSVRCIYFFSTRKSVSTSTDKWLDADPTIIKKVRLITGNRIKEANVIHRKGKMIPVWHKV